MTAENLFYILVSIGMIIFIIFVIKLVKEEDDINETERIMMLVDYFHSDIVNGVISGIFYMNKGTSEENENLAKMYFHEAFYEFKEVKMKIEKYNLLSPEKDEMYELYIEELGAETLQDFCNMYLAGLKELETHITDKKELKEIQQMIEGIMPYIK